MKKKRERPADTARSVATMQTNPDIPLSEQAATKPVIANESQNTVQLLEKARADSDAVLKDLGSQLEGLSNSEADSRLKQYGTNEIAREKRQSSLMRLLSNIKNPLVLLLLALAALSYLTGDLRAMVVILVMV